MRVLHSFCASCLFLVVIVDEALLPIAWAARLSLNPTQRAGVTSLVAAMPAVMGEGLKPLTTSQTPSENSQSAIGSAASAAGEEDLTIRPNSTAMSAATSRGTPMNPSRGRTRGTRRDWYRREP